LKMLHSSFYWDQVWEHSKEQFTPNGKKTVTQSVDFWNKRAEKYIAKTGGAGGNKRVDKVTKWLAKQGVLVAGFSVLDIGAGPGAFAIKFAGEAKEVVSLEPTEIMSHYLIKEVEKRKLDNIKVLQISWEDIDIEKMGYRDQFDLVFASMSPGLNNLITIEKALACSRRYLFISKHAGKRYSDLMVGLWPLLFNEPLPPGHNEALYIANILYNNNYEFDFKVWDEPYEQETGIDEAVDNMLEELKIFGKDSPVNHDQVKLYVQSMADKGLVKNKGVNRYAKILVKKSINPV